MRCQGGRAKLETEQSEERDKVHGGGTFFGYQDHYPWHHGAVVVVSCLEAAGLRA